MNRFNKTVLWVCLTPFVLLPWTTAGADSACGNVAPEINIYPTDPEVTESMIELAGDATGSCLSEIVWSLGEGEPETAIPSSTDWSGVYSWGPITIALAEGVNNITIKADSAAGPGSGIASVAYNPEPPPPLPPPPGANEIIDSKGKLTFYEDPELDRFNIVAYMLTPDEDFDMPCDEDVTVTGYVANPDNPDEDLFAFEETILAGDYGSCTDNRFRRVRSSSDLYEVVMEKSSSTKVYLYVFAWKGSYSLPVEKTAPGYLDYAAGIESYRLDIQVGDQTWSGRSNGPDDNWIKFGECIDLDETIFGRKVELRCNR